MFFLKALGFASFIAFAWTFIIVYTTFIAYTVVSLTKWYLLSGMLGG